MCVEREERKGELRENVRAKVRLVAWLAEYLRGTVQVSPCEAGGQLGRRQMLRNQSKPEQPSKKPRLE